jgi:hypothetical protein
VTESPSSLCLAGGQLADTQVAEIVLKQFAEE